jgi:hypothetical protein
VIARHDRGNEGRNISNCIDITIEIGGLKGSAKCPSVRKRACSMFKRIRAKHGTVLKKNNVTAQLTTTNRCAITIPQQWRWHTRYEAAINKLRELNTGVCRVTGKPFGELIQHFILGGDETCMQGNAGSLRIVGSVERKKHDVNYNDGRASITMYRTGAVSGDQGPTTFLLKGLRKPPFFSDKFLEKNGAAFGSTLIMTESAYMTEVAWETMTPVIVKGIRSMPHIRDNPQWWVIEVFDGFGPHTSSYYSMKYRYDNKILCLKEEGDSSHVNQAYDKFVAKSDKSLQKEGLSIVRDHRWKRNVN